MKFLSFGALCAAGTLLCLGTTAVAGPIAPHPPLSKFAKQMLAAQPGKKVPPCPSEASVGIPAYPGSLCVGVVTMTSGSNDHGPKVLPRLNLVSSASPGKVRKWYAAHLKGWKYDATLKHFVHPDWKFQKFMYEPAVLVKQATKISMALYALGYDLSGMKTHITIVYQAKRAKP